MNTSRKLAVVVVLAFGLGSLAVFFFRGKGGVFSKTQCFNYRYQEAVDIPFGKNVAVYFSPLVHKGTPAGYLHGGQHVVLEALCEGASGTDLKLRVLGDGYVAVEDLIPGFPVPGTKVYLARTALYKDIDAQADNYAQFFSGDAEILEGPQPSATTGYVNFKIRGVDPPHVTGWVPGWVVDHHVMNGMILPEGAEGNVATATNGWSGETRAPLLPKWIWWMIVALLGYGFVRHLTRARAVGWLLGLSAGAAAYELWMGELAIGGLLIVVIVGGIVALHRANAASRPEIEKAEYGIPHCKVEQNPDGFTASFRARGRVFQILVLPLIALGFLLVGIPLCIAAGMYSSWALGDLGATLLASAVFCALIELMRLIERSQTKFITVSRDTVIAGKKKLNRADFGGFRVTKTIQQKEGTSGVLGYGYGVRIFDMDLMLPEREAYEVVAALNKAMITVREAGTESQTTPTQLRETRTTDF